MSEEPVNYDGPEHATGRLVVKYLQESKNGATIADIVRHMRTAHKNESEDLDQNVQSILDNGAALGFLTRKGSHYTNWLAREMCGCGRRRRKSRYKRRRKIRRRQRSCRRRPRRRRCGCR